MFGLMEAGIVTLAKIVGTLVVAIGLIPVVFLAFSGSYRGEPEGDLGDLDH